MSEKLIPAWIEIENFMGIEKMRHELKQTTIIVGTNGVGKTSFIQAVKMLYGGGHDPAVIRNGAEKAVVSIAYTNGVIWKMTVNPSATRRDVEDPVRGRSSLTETYRKTVADPVSFDPLKLVESGVTAADKRDRVDAVLSAFPLAVTKEELVEAVGPAGTVTTDPEGKHALNVIAEVRENVYAARTKINSEADQKNKFVAESKKALPDAEEDVESLLAEKRAEQERLSVEYAKVQGGFNDNYAKETTGADKTFLDREKIANEDFHKAELSLTQKRDKLIADETAKIQAEYAKLIAKESDAKEATVKDLKATLDKAFKDAAVTRDTGLKEAHETYVKPLAELVADITTLIEKKAQADKTQGMRELVEKEEASLSGLVKKSGQYTKAIERLDALKLKLSAALPVAGLEIKDGDLALNSVPWHRVNTAERLKIGVQIAKGNICIIDKAEHIASDVLDEFIQLAEAEGLTTFMARVTAGERTFLETETV